MMLGVFVLWLLFEEWRARRALAAHIRSTAGAQISASTLAMEFQHELFEQQGPR